MKNVIFASIFMWSGVLGAQSMNVADNTSKTKVGLSGVVQTAQDAPNGSYGLRARVERPMLAPGLSWGINLAGLTGFNHLRGQIGAEAAYSIAITDGTKLRLAAGAKYHNLTVGGFDLNTRQHKTTSLSGFGPSLGGRIDVDVIQDVTLSLGAGYDVYYFRSAYTAMMLEGGVTIPL